MTVVRIPHNEGGNQGGEYRPLPDGTYSLRIDKVEEKQSKAGNPQLMVSMVVVEGPQEGKKATDWFVLTEKGVWRLENLLQALYIDPEPSGQYAADGKELVDYDTNYLIGRIALFNVEINSYTKDGVTKTNNKFGTTFDVSPLDPFYAQIEKLKLEDANGAPGEAAQASAPAQTAAPAQAAAAQAPAIVGRRNARLLSAGVR